MHGKEIVEDRPGVEEMLKSKVGAVPAREDASRQTMAYGIMESHNVSDDTENLRIKFDALTSHDITYVGIIQTARASGLDKFPIPYVLTNCHNTLCAVGGTINQDDHMFGLTAAQKYGGIYVPPHQAVIHQYMREMMAGCGKMILGSDSHTRYGALGAMAIGEGGGELAKQILGKTYDVKRPQVIAVYLTGKPQPGVGPQDVALAIIGATFKNGYVKNKVLEFVGDGIDNLSMEYRIGIDVMTTETSCLSSIWKTDDKVSDYLTLHGRAADYKPLDCGDVAYYDGMVFVDMSCVKPMIALPFHPSNAYTIEELNQNTEDILRQTEIEGQKLLNNPKVTFSLRNKVKDGILHVQQATVSGCAGGMFENICAVADILDNHYVGAGGLSLSVYPSSQPIYLEMMKHGVAERLLLSGATVHTAFCGPCFGAGDTPANDDLSIRHVTRNFPNREGSKITNGQIASVALMDARSIAATVINGGKLTPATDLDVNYTVKKYYFDKSIYDHRVFFGYGKADPQVALKFGPYIADWPEMSPMSDHLLLQVASVIQDPVTTTDELIPSGETSSYRSNPLKMAEFTLSRKDPAYVGNAKEIQKAEKLRLTGKNPFAEVEALKPVAAQIEAMFPQATAHTGIGSMIYARKPGDGSAREQAASCQRVLGGCANIAKEYATKRYRSNLINWGLLPFLMQEEPSFETGDFLFFPNIRKAVSEKDSVITGYIVNKGMQKFTVTLGDLTDDERKILLAGCLINFYRG